MITRAIVLGLLLMTPATVAAEPAFLSLTMEEAIPVMQRAPHPLILDVREPAEFAAGHVPGALNVPLGQVGAWAMDQDKDQSLLVICQSGRRSLRACSMLAELGFTQVSDVQGGFRAWLERSPLVEPPVATP